MAKSVSLDAAVPSPSPEEDVDESSVSSSSTSSSSSSTQSESRAMMMLPSMFQKEKQPSCALPPLDDDEDDSEPVPWLPRGINVPSSSPATSRPGHEVPPKSPTVPHYAKDNRMLMPSPLPSPSAAPRKTVLIRPRTLADEESDSNQARREREETAMKRLVHMAKQQQNFATAWFAASAGVPDEAALPVLGPSSRRSSRAARNKALAAKLQRSQSSASSSSSSVSSSSISGPVDVDSGIKWSDGHSVSGSSTTSSASSKMRSFLQLVLPSSSSNSTLPENLDVEKGRAGQSTDTTLNISSNTTLEDQENDKKNSFWQKKVYMVILLVLFVALAAVIIAAIFYTQQNGNQKASSASSSGDISPLFPTATPTSSYAPSVTPTKSLAPSTTEPSASPTLEPSSFPTMQPEPTWAPSRTPSISPTLSPSSVPSEMPSPAPSPAPSSIPSASPSSSPSVAPSSSPSSTPSSSPTISMAPSSMPSMSPTTEFSTTILSQSGNTLEGTLPREQFGNSIALAGNIVAIGARNYGTFQRRAGRVEVYESFEGSWQPRGNFTNLFGRNELDQFGSSLSLSADGNILAVSEPGFDGPAGDRSGNVRVFEYNGESQSWIQRGNDIGGDEATDLFGVSLSLSGSGKYLAVGAPYHDVEDVGNLAGHVKVFEYSQDEEDWQAVATMEGSRELDWFGWSVDLNFDGSILAVGAPRSSEYGGYVQCYSRSSGAGGEAWAPLGNEIVNDYDQVKPDDRFGLAVSLSASGNRVAIGAPWKDLTSSVRNSGMAAVYEFSSEAWYRLGNVLEGNGFAHQLGWSLQLSPNGQKLVVGIPGAASEGINTGRAVLHKYNPTLELWDTASTELSGEAERDEFGYSVAIDEKQIAIGATTSSGQNKGGVGYVKVYEENQNGE